MVIKKKIFAFIFLGLFLISFISAAQITQISSYEGGIEILYPKYDYIKVYSEFELRIHALNSTKSLTNKTIECHFSLYNPDGKSTMHSNLNYSNGATKDEFSIYITPGNFSSLGQHRFNIICNSSTQTGFADGIFEITKTGRSPPTQGEALIILGILASIFFISILFFALSFKIEGAIKFGLIACSFVMALILVLYSNNILSENINGLPATSGGYYIFYYILLAILLIMFLFILLSLTISALDTWRSKKGKNPFHDPS